MPAESNSNYIERARVYDRDAAAAYGRWYASLPEAQQKELSARGLDSYRVDPTKANDREEDAAEYSHCKISPAEFIEALPDELRELFGLNEEQAAGVAQLFGATLERMAKQQKAFLLGRIIGGLLQPGNVQLRIFGLAFAADLDQLNGLGSMEEAGKLCRPPVTRAAVSKAKIEWQDQLELPRGTHSKSPEARAKYSQKAKTDHWRHRKWKSKNPPNQPTNSARSASPS
jgi:hypothetical protein